MLNRQSSIVNHNFPRAFTLIELLAVITILGIIAGLAVPALKQLGQSNGNIGASQQLIADVGRARQLAMADHTTVYMIFVKTNFWMAPGFATPNSWWFQLTGARNTVAMTVATNLCDKQLTGYTFVSLRSAGDQPGRVTARYLAPWQNLPAGTFIAAQKFQSSNTTFNISGYDPNIQIHGFRSLANTIPFPTEDSPKSPALSIPYIAFNYLGQLTDGQNLADRDEYIPLARGSVSPAINPATKALILESTSNGGSASISETPPGNSGIGNNSLSYNIVHIDRLTGRATLESYKMK